MAAVEAHKAHLGRKDYQDRRAPRVHLDLSGRLGQLERLDRLDRRDCRGQLAPSDLKAFRAQLERRARSARLVPPVQLALKVFKASPAQLAQLAQLVQPAPPVRLVHRASPARLVQLVHSDLPAPRAPKVPSA